MIRNLLFTGDVVEQMFRGESTCAKALDTLTIYFQEHVYVQEGYMLDSDRIEEQVRKILHSTIVEFEPHLQHRVKCEILREEDSNLIIDVMVDLYSELGVWDVQTGTRLCH